MISINQIINTYNKIKKLANKALKNHEFEQALRHIEAAASLAYNFNFIYIFLVPFLNLIDQWQMIIIFLSIASMLFGAVAAIGQTNIKRLIAYSSIGHIGYTLAGLATGSNEGIQSSIIYITIYVIMNLALFSCLLMLKRNNEYYENIEDLSGLSKNHPLFLPEARDFCLLIGFIRKEKSIQFTLV